MPSFVQDLSSNNRDGWYDALKIQQTRSGLLFTTDTSQLNIPAFPLTTALTIEEWFIPNRQSSVVRLLEGPVFLRLVGDSQWQFGFGNSLYQAFSPVSAGQAMYVALSHTFGGGQNTLLVLNGQQALGRWLSAPYGATFSDSTDLMTVSTADLPTFSRVQFTTADTLPAPLTLGTDYWTIRQSTTTSRLATSRANAVAGLFINLTTAGSGSHTAYVFQGEELPPFGGYPYVSLGKNDVMQQLRISSTAKSLSTIRSYFNGTSS